MSSLRWALEKIAARRTSPAAEAEELKSRLKRGDFRRYGDKHINLKWNIESLSPDDMDGRAVAKEVKGHGLLYKKMEAAEKAGKVRNQRENLKRAIHEMNDVRGDVPLNLKGRTQQRMYNTGRLDELRRSGGKAVSRILRKGK